VYANARRLRAGELGAGPTSGVWDELRAGVRRHASEAWAEDLGLVHGYTLKFVDEAAMIVDVANEVTGGRAEVWRALVRPPLEQWNRNRVEKVVRLRGYEPRPASERYYARKMVLAEPLDGVRDRTVACTAALRALVDGEVGLRRAVQPRE
jgi:hypothetical protein